MSKYLDVNNEIDMNKIEETYLAYTESALKSARERAEYLLNEIKYYRENSFEKIELDVRERYHDEVSFPEDYSKHRKIAMCARHLMRKENAQMNKETFDKYRNKVMSMDDEERKKLIDIVVEKEEIGMCAYYLSKNDKRGKEESLSKEERKEILKKEIQDRKILMCAYYLFSKNENPKYSEKDDYINDLSKMSSKEIDDLYEEYVESRIEQEQKNDIIFDLLTEEQISNLVNLYTEKRFKEHLIEARNDAINKTAEDLGKKGLKHGYAHYEYEIAKIEDVNIQEQADRDKVSDIKDFFAVLAAYITGGTITLGTIMNLIEFFSGNPELMSLSHYAGAAACMAIPIVLALPFAGVHSLITFFKDKKAMQKAKELGLYDVIVDSIKSNNEFLEYVQDLGIEDFAKERSII